MCVASLRLFPGNAMRMLGTNAVRSTNACRLPSIHIALGSQEHGLDSSPSLTELLGSNSLGYDGTPNPCLSPLQLGVLSLTCFSSMNQSKPEAKKPKKAPVGNGSQFVCLTKGRREEKHGMSVETMTRTPALSRGTPTNGGSDDTGYTSTEGATAATSLGHWSVNELSDGKCTALGHKRLSLESCFVA